MNIRIAALLTGLMAVPLAGIAAETPQARPKSGKVEIMPLSQVKQGMKGTAWTVFQGTQPESFGVQVTGIVRNALGPGKSLIICELTDPRIRAVWPPEV